MSDNNESKFLPFAQLQPHDVEFTSIFPPYPKSHINGYATVIELDETITNVDAVTKLRNGIQYSLTGGHGKRVKPVPFFSTEDNPDIQMHYHYRQCAGVKVCEFFPTEMRTPHTEVDPDGHQWAQQLAQQEHAEAMTFSAQLETLFEEYYNDPCPKPLYNGKKCGGRTIIGSLKPKSTLNAYNRLFIGCENFDHTSKRKDTHHHFIRLIHHDPVAVINLWGKDRCFIHQDILDDLGITWDQDELGKCLLNSCLILPRNRCTSVLCSLFQFTRIQRRQMSLFPQYRG